MKMNFFKLAKKMSYKSTHNKHKIGGVLVKKSKIISLGFNKSKTHTKSTHLFKHIHCELDCILGISKEELLGASIYLYRQNKDGTVAMSRPCKWCYEMLKEAGIKTVYYTDCGNFKKEDIA